MAAAAAGPVAAEEEEEKGKGYSVEELEELAEWRAHAGDEVPVWSETVVPEKDVGDNAKVLAMRAGVLGFVASFSAFGSAYSDRESGRAALPRRYDPAAVARYFAIRPDKVLYRLFQLVAEAARLSALSASHKVAEVLLDVQRLPQKYRDERKEQRTQQHAAALRDAAARLGPAAVKLAQAAATRPDIFGSELARELQTLHDAVAAPFPVGEAFHLMKQQIGASPHAVFDEIDEKPVANASLGMVFRGVLDGKPVAIKVQRPGVTESIALDFYIVRSCAGFLQRFFKIRTEMRQAVDDYASRMFEELDYRTEVDNMAKFESMYGEVPGICIPKAYKLYTTRKVLVTDWVTGRKIIDDESNVRVEELGVVETGIKFALTQLLDKGYLHAGT